MDHAQELLTVICLVETHRWAGWITPNRVPMQTKAGRRGDDLAVTVTQRSTGAVHQVTS